MTQHVKGLAYLQVWIERLLYNCHLGQSIQDLTKRNLRKTAF